MPETLAEIKEKLATRTFGDVMKLMETPNPNLPQEAIEFFVSQARPYSLVGIYAEAARGDARIFYVRPANTKGETRVEIHELERVCHINYPSLRLSFRGVSTGDLTPELIQAFREKWIPSGQLVYAPQNNKTD